jgi:NAD(P)H-dependent FMN reductase
MKEHKTKVLVVIASTRPGRVGKPIAEWFIEEVKKDVRFQIEVADLAEINLPFFDEPEHPVLQKYTKSHTIEWSKTVAGADAFIFVTPEYNFGAPAPLINALDFLSKEWNYKPVGFVSYGGVSGGTRSVQHIKQIVTTLKMVPLYEAINIPFFRNNMKEGIFVPGEQQTKAVQPMMDELNKLASALKPLHHIPSMHQTRVPARV